MSTTPVNLPRPLPRFLPTLTEVVQPSELAAILSATNPMSTAPRPASTQPVEQKAAALELDPEIQALVNAAVAAQMPLLQTRLLQELEIMVQHAVHEAMNSNQAPS